MQKLADQKFMLNPYSSSSNSHFENRSQSDDSLDDQLV